METETSKTKSALNYGAILGLVLMIFSLIVYLFELYDSWLNWLGVVVLILGIIYGIKNFRDRERGGFITYGGAVGYGTLIALFASIITAFGTYIYLGFVDDGFLEYQRVKQEEVLYESGLSDEQIEQQLEMAGRFMGPGVIAVSSIFTTTIVGLIVALIAGIFLKREPEHFDQT
jgi:hypothetical protein